MFSALRNLMFGVSNDPTISAPTENVPVSPTPKTVSVNLPLPEDLIIVILSYVPASDLLNNCAYVEEWESLINSQILWSLKCERDKKVMPTTRPSHIPDNFYRHLYFARFNENLLKNPCGQDNLNHWKEMHVRPQRRYSENSLEGWVVENPPNGADKVPDTECQFCFATTYYWCRKGQLIDLWEEGFKPDLIQVLMPTICICEWYCARFDCGSEYELEVRLLDEHMVQLDKYFFRHVETQWTGRAWSQTKHEFTEYSTSIRYVHFMHSGKDTQFWAGNYGSKMAEAQVILRLS